MRNRAIMMMWSISDSDLRSMSLASAAVNDPLTVRGRLAGGAPEGSPEGVPSAWSSESSAATGTHFDKNHDSGRPTSTSGCHCGRRACSAASTCRLNSATKGRRSPHAGGSRSLVSRPATSSSKVLGVNANVWRIEKRDLIRFSSRLVTSTFSDIPTMHMRTSASWATSKRLYSSVCRDREQKCSNLSRTMIAAPACLKLSFMTAQSHSRLCSKLAFPSGNSRPFCATCEARWRMHSASVP
mmetsp:Transcript_68496/g.178359  ORF Transcript_68496/g.178359 Transcript_68496/m.178359 type:complete len:241 (-) Transcript_68496:398-1120(-)